MQHRCLAGSRLIAALKLFIPSVFSDLFSTDTDTDTKHGNSKGWGHGHSGLHGKRFEGKESYWQSNRVSLNSVLSVMLLQLKVQNRRKMPAVDIDSTMKVIWHLFESCLEIPVVWVYRLVTE